MRDDIMRLIEAGRLALAPFKPLQSGKTAGRSISVNPSLEGTLFALADEKTQTLTLYMDAAPITAYVKAKPELLLSIFSISGPVTACPALRLGSDPHGRYIWASRTLNEDACREDRICDAIEAFRKDAAAMRLAVMSKINEAVESGRSQRAAADAIREASQARASAAAKAETQDAPKAGTTEQAGPTSFEDFMNGAQILWG